ncbi:MAG: hypothetical protein ACFUZC_07055 [Chthoniobacteraceae bacterium]
MAQSPHQHLSPGEARKAALIAELSWSRERLSTHFQETLHDLNVVEHLRHSIKERKTAWFTGAAVTGGLLSWIFGRKRHKSPKKPKPRELPGKRVEIPRNGYLGIALAVFTFLFNLLKPVLSRVATRKIEELAARGGR